MDLRANKLINMQAKVLASQIHSCAVGMTVITRDPGKGKLTANTENRLHIFHTFHTPE
jgi:hypothetical protein